MAFAPPRRPTCKARQCTWISLRRRSILHLPRISAVIRLRPKRDSMRSRRHGSGSRGTYVGGVRNPGTRRILFSALKLALFSLKYPSVLRIIVYLCTRLPKCRGNYMNCGSWYRGVELKYTGRRWIRDVWGVARFGNLRPEILIASRNTDGSGKRPWPKLRDSSLMYPSCIRC